MHVERAQVDDDQDDVRPVRGPLAVTQQLVVSHFMEMKIPVAVKGRVLSPDAIHVANKLAQTILSAKIPLLDLIFFRMQILLASHFPGHALSQFKCGTVDAVARTERRRQDEARHECGPAAVLELLSQNIRRIGPEVRAKVFANVRLRQLSEVLRELRLRGAPGKIIVGLRKAKLREPQHHFWPRERFSEKDHIGIDLLRLADHPFPESKWLRMWIVDAKYSDSLTAPIQDDALQFIP